ncbi:MAG TPA: phosphoribosyltransferase family protein [Bacteroidia bacterium]|nr:phosphoribosyltransferase family protein [Bacteroidia bacterium]
MIRNREEAGRQLAEKLAQYENANAVVLAVPRGGVPVGYEIAKKLNLPLHLLLSKKIGHPLNPEYAIGSVTMDDVILNGHEGVSPAYIEQEVRKIREALRKKITLYNGTREVVSPAGKTVIVVDDGIATGKTLLVLIQMLRRLKPKRIVVAVPVMPESVVDTIQTEVDELVYLHAPFFFRGVGMFYDDFKQVEDEEVISLLHNINHVH